MPYCFDSGADPNNTASQAFYTGDLPRAIREAMRQSIVRDARGYYAETYPWQASPSNQAAISGTVYFNPIGLLAGDLVTNIISCCHTAGNTLTLVKFGLYKTDGTLLGSTADCKADFAATGPKVEPLTTPYRVLTNGLYYVAYLATGTTGPSLYRGLSGGNAPGAISPSSIVGTGTWTGQTDMVTSATITASGTTINYWHGVS